MSYPCTFALLLLCAAPALAQPDSLSNTVADSLTGEPLSGTNIIHLGEMLVQADRATSAASAQTVREFDLQIRPRASAQQILQLAPGLVIAQHAGGGKAEQIFLRGFDCDHGTDVAISVDGMPVNMVSHGHGQGYADLHFLIPETVEGMEVAKGPYAASPSFSTTPWPAT